MQALLTWFLYVNVNACKIIFHVEMHGELGKYIKRFGHELMHVLLKG